MSAPAFVLSPAAAVDASAHDAARVDAAPIDAASVDAAPFDAAAQTYDAVFTDTLLGRWLRAAVHDRLAPLVRAGDRVLELGCGTGADAVWLAARGAHVIATDASPAMLRVARQRAVAAGVEHAVTWAQLDIARPPLDATLPPGHSNSHAPRADAWLDDASFDAVLANFGVLNCVRARAPIAAWLGARVRPGGHVVLVLMGRICPWEIGWHLLRARPRSAVRRLRGGRMAHVGGGAAVAVWYPTPRAVRAEFAPWFRTVDVRGLGVLLPPSYLAPIVDRHARLFGALCAVETRIAGRFPCTWLNDHYIVVLERR